MDRWEAGEYRFERPKSMILMLPVLEIRMFSILRSVDDAQSVGAPLGYESRHQAASPR